MNIPETNVETTVRTMFPRITPHAPGNDLLWLGCMKGIEERGASGYLYPRPDVVREIRDVKVNITPSKKGTLAQGDLPRADDADTRAGGAA